jgi:chaperone required for assembly of F1-ATPase
MFNSKINPWEACNLSRLEARYQINKWGTIEWQHDVEIEDLVSRLSASLLIYQLSRETYVKSRCND